MLFSQHLNFHWFFTFQQYWEFHFLQLVVPENIMEQGITASVSLQYFLNRDERNAKDRYVWLFGGWSFCSVSCGGGTRQKMIVCKDEKTGRIVSRRKCPLTTKPSQEIEKCNAFRYQIYSEIDDLLYWKRRRSDISLQARNERKFRV